MCKELFASWAPVMSFGKHKGKLVSEVPRGYLRWTVANVSRMNPELRATIERHLNSPAKGRRKQWATRIASQDGAVASTEMTDLLATDTASGQTA